MRNDIITNTLNIPIKENGNMRVYVAKPDRPGKFPLVLIGMEIYGVNDNIKDVANRVAGLGYVAVAMDFYHRTSPGVVFSSAEREKALELVFQLRRDEVIYDIRTAIDFFKKRNEITEKVGFLGISIGGHLAYLAAARLPITATVVLYGTLLTNPDVTLGQPEPTVQLTAEIAKRNGKILFFVGSLDHMVTPDQVEHIRAELEETNTVHEVIVYPGAKHRFFNDSLPEFYDRAASNDAWSKIVRFFNRELVSK